jgi:hypothetical protein
LKEGVASAIIWDKFANSELFVKNNWEIFYSLTLKGYLLSYLLNNFLSKKSYWTSSQLRNLNNLKCQVKNPILQMELTMARKQIQWFKRAVVTLISWSKTTLRHQRSERKRVWLIKTQSCSRAFNMNRKIYHNQVLTNRSIENSLILTDYFK